MDVLTGEELRDIVAGRKIIQSLNILLSAIQINTNEIKLHASFGIAYQTDLC